MVYITCINTVYLDCVLTCICLHRWTEIQVTVEGKDDVIEYVGEDDNIKDYILYVRW